MTKLELQQKQEYYRRKLNEINAELERMDKVFTIHDKEKPFRKYSVIEMNELFDISQDAFNWLSENNENNILDYNAQASKDKQVNFDRL